MITAHETEIARYCISYATAQGADAARVSLSKSVMDGYTILNGELDKVTHSADRSIYLYIFADGRYGTFSTNRLEKPELEDFIRKATETLEKEIATLSSTLAWKIPWMEKPGRLQSMGSLRVRHNRAISLSPICSAKHPATAPPLFLFFHPSELPHLRTFLLQASLPGQTSP